MFQLLSVRDGPFDMGVVSAKEAAKAIEDGAYVEVYVGISGEATPEIGLIFKDGVYHTHGLGHDGVERLFAPYKLVAHSGWEDLLVRAEELVLEEYNIPC